MLSSASTPHERPLRDAASVVLVRDGSHGVESFMLTRAPTMAFSAGATVFPGGGVENADRRRAQQQPTIALPVGTEAFGDDDVLVRATLLAAIRETAEECGVLLSSALASLRPLSRWVTPYGYPRRYDTRFFLAALPPGQDPVLRTSEAVSAGWTTAEEAFSGFGEGRIFLMPPTWSQLYTISSFASVEELERARIDPLAGTPAQTPATPEELVVFPGAELYYAQAADYAASKQ